ncbi:MAG TPA: hypothetical protein VFC27_04220, partial [Anaerovoracaceae bacterium]|nr:hypothetical protein [Anaerovoracaceae bacterium]
GSMSIVGVEPVRTNKVSTFRRAERSALCFHSLNCLSTLAHLILGITKSDGSEIFVLMRF